jgi:DNA-binding transcriptional ArsR family regulator
VRCALLAAAIVLLPVAQADEAGGAGLDAGAIGADSDAPALAGLLQDAGALADPSEAGGGVPTPDPPVPTPDPPVQTVLLGCRATNLPDLSQTGLSSPGCPRAPLREVLHPDGAAEDEAAAPPTPAEDEDDRSAPAPQEERPLSLAQEGTAWEEASVPERPSSPSDPSPGPTPLPQAVVGAPSPPPGAQWPRALLAWGAAAAAPLALKLASLLLALRRRSGSPLRGKVLDLVAADPGVHHMDLARRAGHGKGAMEHHLLALLREGKVVRLRTPGYTCYFAAGGAGADPRLPWALASMRGRTPRRLVAAVAGGPTRSLSELAAALGLAVSTAHYHASRLVRAGLLADVRSGGRRGFALTELGRACLASTQPAVAGS